MRKKLHLLSLSILFSFSVSSNSEMQDISFLRKAREILKTKSLGHECLGKLEEAYHVYMRRHELLVPIKKAIDKRKELESEFNQQIQGIIDSQQGKGQTLESLAIFSRQVDRDLTKLYQKVDDIYADAEKYGTDEALEEADKLVLKLGVSEKEVELQEIREALAFDSLLAGHRVENDLNSNGLILSTNKGNLTFYTSFNVDENNKVTTKTVVHPKSLEVVLDWSDREIPESGFKSTFSSRFDGSDEPYVSVKTDYTLNLITAYRALGIWEEPYYATHHDHVFDILNETQEFEDFYFAINESLKGQMGLGPKDCGDYLKKNDTRTSESSDIKSYEINHDFSPRTEVDSK